MHLLAGHAGANGYIANSPQAVYLPAV